jgi:hypothetical protein
MWNQNKARPSEVSQLSMNLPFVLVLVVVLVLDPMEHEGADEQET